MRAKEFIVESISVFADTIKDKLGLAQLYLYEKNNDIYLDTIVVGKENQGKGLGSKALQLLTDYADKNQQRIILTPAVKDPIHGTTSRNRLVSFYKQFGFKESKGRNIDYAIGAGKMYRDPQIEEYNVDTLEYNGIIPVSNISTLKKGVAESGAETSWSDDTDTITLQDILELTKHIKQINLPITDKLTNKLLHWDGNPEEMERINQVTVSKQFPILVILDEQGQIYSILDGNHRLHKAIQSRAETIPAKLIKPSDLSDKAKKILYIRKQGVAEGEVLNVNFRQNQPNKEQIERKMSLKGQYLHQIEEYKVDNKKGLGAVPANAEVDYFGLRVLMKPSTFLSLAASLQSPRSSVEYIRNHLKQGGKLGSPFLTVDIPIGWGDNDFSEDVKVIGHEGRHRMTVVMQEEGDSPVEVHIFPHYMRARDITPEMVKELNKSMINQDGKKLTGPFFKQM